MLWKETLCVTFSHLGWACWNFYINILIKNSNVYNNMFYNFLTFTSSWFFIFTSNKTSLFFLKLSCFSMCAVLIYKYKMKVILNILFKSLFWHLRIGQMSHEKQQSIMRANYSSEKKWKAEQSSRKHWTCQNPLTSSPSCDFQRRCSSTNEDSFSLEKRSTVLTCFGRNDVRFTVSIEFCCSQIQRWMHLNIAVIIQNTVENISNLQKYTWIGPSSREKMADPMTCCIIIQSQTN